MCDTDTVQTDVSSNRKCSDGSSLNAKHLFGLFSLVLLADFLFWGHSAGVSLVLFSAALSGVAIANLRPSMTHRKRAAAIAVWIASALPVLEYVQPISILFLVAGHLGLLILIATHSTAANVVRNLLRLTYLLPDFLIKTWPSIGRSIAAQKRFTLQRDTLSGWVLPLGVGSVFFALFLLANPVLVTWIDTLFDLKLSLDTIRRLTFWGVVAVMVLPFILFRYLAETFSRQAFQIESQCDFEGRLINARSITNSLLIFNVMFVFQNATDMAFLWGGTALPQGMTYANYAHKGAYPLMLTSVLAGFFAVMTRRYLGASALLRCLLFLWVAQNMFLVGSALARLGLYVDAYSLTYLRMRAAIGMGLVFVGMVLLLWQLSRAKPNRWVTNIFAAIVVVTLYCSSFVNFGQFIAKTNIAQSDRSLDVAYLCDETPDGLQAIVTLSKQTGVKYCALYRHNWSRQIDNWRSWSLRQARLDAAFEEYSRLPPQRRWSLGHDPALRRLHQSND